MSLLAYAVNRSDVTAVLVNGVVVVRDGKVTTVDEREAIARVREVASRIAASPAVALVRNRDLGGCVEAEPDLSFDKSHLSDHGR